MRRRRGGVYASFAFAKGIAFFVGRPTISKWLAKTDTINSSRGALKFRR
jgi:hypothetical protein